MTRQAVAGDDDQEPLPPLPDFAAVPSEVDESVQPAQTASQVLANALVQGQNVLNQGTNALTQGISVLNQAGTSGVKLAFPGGTFDVGGSSGTNALVPITANGAMLHLNGNANVQVPGTNQIASIPGTLALPLSQNGATPAGLAASPVVVTPPQSPINISIPVTNNTARPRRYGLFHRGKEPISPSNPTKPPLMERLLNRP